MTTMFQDSKWIWPDNHGWDLHNGYALFRKEFEVSRLPTRAPLFITADQSYQLYVNGHYVCRGPARGFQKSWPYDEIDIRPYLQPGRNILAIRSYNPGFSNFQYVSQGYAGLLVAAKWKGISLVSDPTWKCRRQSGVRRDTVPSSIQLFGQEHIDLREEDPAWMEPDYDDSGWTTSVATRPWNSMPWYALEARGLPMLEEKIIAPTAGIGIASGRCAPDSATPRDVCRIRYKEGLAHKAIPFDPETIEVKPSGRGRFRSYLVDFGKTVVGSIGFSIDGAKGGEIVDTLHAETIDASTLAPHFAPDKHCRMAFGHRLICREGPQSHTFYHAFGFRYLVLTVRDSSMPLRIRTHLRTSWYPLEQNGQFSSSEPILNEIWNACAWTQRVCSLDAYVDTPWREQAQWWGDARVQAKNTFFYSGNSRLFRRGIAQIAGQTTPEGLTYGHAPTMAHDCILPDFTLTWIITLWDYYWQTGSLEPFLAHQDTAERALKCFETDSTIGLVGYDSRYWLFLDWADLFKGGYPTLLNLWLLMALEKMARLYSLSDQPEKAKAAKQKASRLRTALRQLERKDGLLGDGLDFRRRSIKSTSLHSQTLAILAGLSPERDAVKLRTVLLPFIRGAKAVGPSPSAYWITYLFEVLTAAGYGNDVVTFIRDHWQGMAAHGTTWETFSPRLGDESCSHAWSAHPLYHLMQTLGGIRQTACEWSEIVFEPIFVGHHALALVPTPQGPISSRWERTPNGIEVELNLPADINARVKLAGQRAQKVTGRNLWNIKSDRHPERSE